MAMHYAMKDARFVLSAPSVAQLPEPSNAEVIFVGRSNVGKSSLLNFIASRRQLAHVSRTPGRTRALNVFEAIVMQKDDAGLKQERPFRFLDLPGFGYAQMSQAEKARLSDVLGDYLESGRPIRVVFHLMDCRRDITEEDHEVSQALRHTAGEYVAVFTKIDQVAPSKRTILHRKLAAELEIRMDQCVVTSTKDQIGRNELLGALWEHLATSPPSRRSGTSP